MPHPDLNGGRSPDDLAHPSLGNVLAWLDRHVNLEAIERGQAGRSALPTLERIAALLASMGDPQTSYPIVHVTGTNGKGSTTRIATALLEMHGLVVGSYTSPHLERLNERIARGGEPISDRDLASTLAALEVLEQFVTARTPNALLPTWFELVTAAAFRYFADEAVDAAVIEVGLGGRFDATNVANGSVAVVTNIELDHVEILGTTRAAIAREKAGIVKAGSIVVVGETDDELVGIFSEEARAVGAEVVWRRGEDFDCTDNRLAHGGRLLALRTPGASYDGVYVPLAGAHQGENVAVALAAAEAFFGAALDEALLAEALAGVRVPGRLEVVGRRPLVVLDGAHNAAGAAALGAALADDFSAPERILLVMGCLRGRDPREMLAAIGVDRLAHVVACAPPSPRALPARVLSEAASALGVPTSVVDPVPEALAAALELARPDDLIVVTGSLYVVGAAKTEMRRLTSTGP